MSFFLFINDFKIKQTSTTYISHSYVSNQNQSGGIHFDVTEGSIDIINFDQNGNFIKRKKVFL
jgi:hypothetical protein